MPGNGTIPIGSAPPPDVQPSETDYIVVLGMIENLPGAESQVPSEFFDLIQTTQSAAIAFSEYALDEVNDSLTVVDLEGQTIDWINSELPKVGTVNLQLGTQRPYRLEGKPYMARKYTFLSMNLSYNDGGTPKSMSWAVRMKHF